MTDPRDLLDTISERTHDRLEKASRRAGRRTVIARAEALYADEIFSLLESEFDTVDYMVMFEYVRDLRISDLEHLIEDTLGSWDTIVRDYLKQSDEEIAKRLLTRNNYKALKHPVKIENTKFRMYGTWLRASEELFDGSAYILCRELRAVLEEE